MDDASAPVVTRRECNRDLAYVQRLPLFKLVDLVESKIGDQASDPFRDDDRLKSGDLTKSPSVEMIEMGMRYEDNIDHGQMVE